MTQARETPHSPGWVSYAPFLPVLLLFLGSIGFALVKSSALERDMRIAVTQNMLWVVSQTQMEIQALMLSAALGTQDPATLSSRYDLTVSRLNLLNQGPQARYLEDIGHLDSVASMLSELLALDLQIQGHSAESHAALFALTEDLQPEMNRIANDVMITDWNKSAARLDAFRATQRLIILAVVFSFLAALAISWVLLRKQRQLHMTQVRSLRTAKLLEQQQDIASMYRDFAAIVSHQLRTPLSLIDSAMHRLVRKGDAVTAQDVVERRAIIADSVGRLTRLSDTVLLLARLDNEQLQADFAPLSLLDAARAAMAEAQTRSPNRELRLSSAKGRLIAGGDVHLVGHILEILVSNAIKFSPEDRPVELRVFGQGAELACAVTDQGPGIDATDQPYVFERYYRGNTQKEGAGLGLSIARALAELQGGRITFETWPDKGSVFTLWLPRAPDGDGNDSA